MAMINLVSCIAGSLTLMPDNTAEYPPAIKPLPVGNDAGISVTVATMGAYTIKAYRDPARVKNYLLYFGATLLSTHRSFSYGIGIEKSIRSDGRDYFNFGQNKVTSATGEGRGTWTIDPDYLASYSHTVWDAQHTRNSDTQNTVWAMFYQGSDWTPYARIQRSTDGGGWTDVWNGTVPSQGFGVAGVSFIDTSCSANHTYSYRSERKSDNVNWDGYSPFSPSTVTRNTPAATGTPSAMKVGDVSVHLTFANSANSETGTKIQRTSDNGATVVDVATTPPNATTYDDLAAPAGTVKYRTINVAGELESAPSAWSNAVTTMAPPYAPTLTDKPDNYVSKAAGSVLLKWLHNSADGSAQSAAEIEVTAATTQTYSVTTAQEYSLDLAAIDSMQGVSWRVRTKGLHADFGPWSDPDTFTVANPPQAIVTYPTVNDSVETDVPINVTFDYGDAGAFQLASWTLDLYKGDERVHTYTSNTHEAYPLGLDTYMPENNTDYRIVISVRSGSGLTGTVERLFAVAYEPPAIPDLEYVIDTEAASVQLTALAGIDGATTPATDHLSVVRLDPDGSVTVLAANVATGTVLTDRLPLLNRATAYRVYSHAANGVVAYLDVPITVDVGGFFFWNFGTDYAKCAYNSDWDDGYETDKALYHPIGRKHPTAYYGSGRKHSLGFAGELYDDPAAEQAFVSLADFGGDVVYRDPHGRRLTVSADVKTSGQAGARKVSVSVDMTQVG